MSIFLCSPSESIRERWYKALVPPHKEVYQATSLSELSSLSSKIKVDLLLLHRDIAPLETVLQIRQSFPDCKIFILSNRPEQLEGLQFLQYGVVGYANTYIAPGRLTEAVQTILAGSVWIGQDLMQRLIKETFQAGKKEPVEKPVDQGKKQMLRKLSDREYQIANLVAQGLANMDIAESLAITERTVKAHLSSIYAKTGTKGRLNLALLVNRGS